VRIIAGQWRGRPLSSPPPGDSAIRPTPDRVREALFSSLMARLGRWAGVQVADLCAGTGALSFEALSRGAAHATLVETATAARALIQRTAATLGCADRITLLNVDVLALPVRSSPVDLLLLDPPYADNREAAILQHAHAQGWIGAVTLCVVETPAKRTLDVDGFTQLDARRYGATAVHLFHCAV
jgi:16S rRNA (guanine966-N2)-methyltransferase